MYNFNNKQLQRKFKHAIDFGITGSYNPQNILAYQQTLFAHINAPTTYIIRGTYHQQPVIHHFNPVTNNNVIFDLADNFVSGWKLSPAQIWHLTHNNAL